MDVANHDMPDNVILAFVTMHWMEGPTRGLRYYKAAFDEKGKSSMNDAFAVYVDTPIGSVCFPRILVRPHEIGWRQLRIYSFGGNMRGEDTFRAWNVPMSLSEISETGSQRIL